MFRRMLAVLVLICIFPLCAFAHPAIVDLVNHPETEWTFQDGTEILEVVFPRVQGADACILRLGGRVMMVDAATVGQHDYVAEALAHMGIDHVDTGFNTHPHDDHIGGFMVLNQAATLGELYITFPEDANYGMRNALRAMKEQNVPVKHAVNGDLLPFGDVRLEVIQREESWFVENDRSAMLRLEYGNRSLLLTADVDRACQNNLLKTAPEKLAADIFKYPHHGVSPAGWNFLEHIGADMAIVTNSPGRVKDTVKDSQKRGITMIYTAQGMVRLRTDGEIWVVDQLVLNEE